MNFSTFLFLLLVVLAFVGWTAVKSYNGLRSMSEKVKATNANVQSSISRKINLINLIIDAVKSYQQGEQLVHLQVSSDTAGNGLAAAYQQSGAMLATVQNIAERFPHLKSGEQYHRLITSIQEAENNLQQWRQAYNADVQNYNSYRGRLPQVLFSSALGFPPAPYLEFDREGNQDFNQLKTFNPDNGERLERMLTAGGRSVVQGARSLASGAADRLLNGSAAPREPATAPAAANGTASVAPAPLVSYAPPSPAALQAAARGGGTQVFSMPQPNIRFVAGPLNGTVVAVNDGVVVGREPPAQVVVPDPQVSTTHAWIGARDGNVIFVDRGSTNGSAVNGAPVHPQQETPLRPGDTVTLGRSGAVQFVVEMR